MIAIFEQKLPLWKNLPLLLGGRITFIMSCLANLLVHYLSLFKMPVSVAKRLEKGPMQRGWEIKEEVALTEMRRGQES